MSVKFLLLEGGVWGGGGCRFYFYGRAGWIQEGFKGGFCRST